MLAKSGSNDVVGTGAAPQPSGTADQQNTVEMAQSDDGSGISTGAESGMGRPDVGSGIGQNTTENMIEAAAANGDATAPVTAPSPAPSPQSETVAAFLLQGHMGRTALSCDGG